MQAEIVSVGTELLLGEIIDTNAAFLAQQLSLLGIDLYWISQVGDNQSRLLDVLRRAWDRSQLVLITGGLGPTEDDITREAIAGLLGEEMLVDPALEKWLRDTFARFQLTMPSSNLKQATLIKSAQSITNPFGTAPGWWVQRDGRIIVAMPGVPREMRRMWQEEVLPRLRPLAGTQTIVSRVLKVMGKGEADVAEMLQPFIESSNPTLATYAKDDGIHLRLTAKAPDKPSAERMITHRESEIRSLLGTFIYGADEETLSGVIGGLLRQSGLTLATMESCTGGLLSHAITEVPGSSSYYRGGFVSYSKEMKVNLGVDAALIERYGTVSPQAAEAMALAARQRLGSDIGLAVTGVAGPGEWEGQPAGTVYIALNGRETTKASSGFHPTTRSEIKRIATLRALNLLRRWLLGAP